MLEAWNRAGHVLFHANDSRPAHLRLHRVLGESLIPPDRYGCNVTWQDELDQGVSVPPIKDDPGYSLKAERASLWSGSRLLGISGREGRMSGFAVEEVVVRLFGLVRSE